MPLGMVVGCLHVEFKSLHAALLPATAQATDRLKAQLLVVARSACQERLASLQGRLKALRARPQALQEHVVYQVPSCSSKRFDGTPLAILRIANNIDTYAPSMQAMHMEQVEQQDDVVITTKEVDEMYALLAAVEQRTPMADQVTL